MIKYSVNCNIRNLYNKMASILFVVIFFHLTISVNDSECATLIGLNSTTVDTESMQHPLDEYYVQVRVAGTISIKYHYEPGGSCILLYNSSWQLLDEVGYCLSDVKEVSLSMHLTPGKYYIKVRESGALAPYVLYVSFSASTPTPNPNKAQLVAIGQLLLKD